MVIAAVCQPLATRPPNRLALAAASSRWKGWGSNWAAKALISAASTVSELLTKVWPTTMSSKSSLSKADSRLAKGDRPLA